MGAAIGYQGSWMEGQRRHKFGLGGGATRPQPKLQDATTTGRWVGRLVSGPWSEIRAAVGGDRGDVAAEWRQRFSRFSAAPWSTDPMSGVSGVECPSLSADLGGSGAWLSDAVHCGLRVPGRVPGRCAADAVDVEVNWGCVYRSGTPRSKDRARATQGYHHRGWGPDPRISGSPPHKLFFLTRTPDSGWNAQRSLRRAHFGVDLQHGPATRAEQAGGDHGLRNGPLAVAADARQVVAAQGVPPRVLHGDPG